MERTALRRSALAIGGVLLFVAVAFALATHHTQVKEMSFEGIPLPFAQDSTSVLKGAVTHVSTKNNGIEVSKVTFPAGTTQELLDIDKIYLVSVPNDSAIKYFPLFAAISKKNNNQVHNINYYGYAYTTKNATQEILNQNNPALSFKQRFPGTFFASVAALSPSLSSFEANNGIHFVDVESSQAPKLGSGLFILVVNEGFDDTDNNAVRGGRFSIPANICGDGVIFDTEACDDANGLSADGCYTCQVETGYTCTGIPSTCVTTCGDGIKAGTEVCDDGNTNNSDGCAGVCNAIEPGYTCSGNPSVCSMICGNGTIDFGEECDDGVGVNGEPGSTCTTECAVVPLPF